MGKNVDIIQTVKDGFSPQMERISNGLLVGGKSVKPMGAFVKKLSGKIEMASAVIESLFVMKRLFINFNTLLERSNGLKLKNDKFELPDGILKRLEGPAKFNRIVSTNTPVLGSYDKHINTIEDNLTCNKAGLKQHEIPSDNTVGCETKSESMPKINTFKRVFANNAPEIDAEIVPMSKALTAGIVLAGQKFDKIKTVTSVLAQTFSNFASIALSANSVKHITSSAELAINSLMLHERNRSKAAVTVERANDLIKKVNALSMATAGTGIESSLNGKDSLLGANGLTSANKNALEIVNSREYLNNILYNKDKIMSKNEQNITLNVNVNGNMIGNNEFLNQLKSVFATQLKTAMAVQ